MIVPNKLISGDSWSTTYTPTDPNYAPSEGWSLLLSIRGTTVHDFTATVSGNSYVIDIDTDSATYSGGTYRYIVTLNKTGQRKTVETGQVEISDDLSAVETNYDARTHEQKMLAVIEAHLEKRAVGQIDHLVTTIDGKTLQRMSTNEVLDLRNRYKSMVNRQLRGNFPKSVKYDFNGLGI